MTATASVATIRAWAAAEGLDVAERGRLKPEVVNAYEAAHARPVAGKLTSAKPSKTPIKSAAVQPVQAVAKASRKSGAAEKVSADSTSSQAVQQPREDLRFTDLDLALRQLTARVARLEADASASATNKRKFGRKR